jgi:hypothetical protein
MPFFIGGTVKLRIGAPLRQPHRPPPTHPATAPAPANVATPLMKSRRLVVMSKSFLFVDSLDWGDYTPFAAIQSIAGVRYR